MPPNFLIALRAIMDMLKPKDIRFWIIAFFIVRLYAIWHPPIEVVHNWRQTTVTMVARNFYEGDANILLPKIDIAGEKTGITGMEFPLLNYLIYLVSLVFGYEHWYGRLINLLFSSLGVWYFFKLIKYKFNESVAFNSSIVLLFSIWYTYSRKIMPDTFSMSLMIAGIYYALKYLDTGKLMQYVTSIALICLGTLAKLPSAFILILLALPIFKTPIFKKRKIILSAGLVLSMLVPAWYYFKWVPYLTEYYGFEHFFMGKTLMTGTKELIEHWQITLGRFYDTAIKYIGFAMLLFGLYRAFKLKEKVYLYIAGLGFLGFLPIMLKGGFNFYHHSYYMVPFVPVMALVSGYGISQLPGKLTGTIVLFAIGIEGFFNHLDDFRIKDHMRPILTLETLFDNHANKNDLILINSGEFPTPMYFAHRKGWVGYNEQIVKPHYVDSLKDLGLKHILILKQAFGTEIEPGIDSNWKTVESNVDYTLYSLTH